MTTGEKTLPKRSLSAVTNRVTGVLRYTRFQLAFKATLAVGIAWTVAPHVPGVASQYPYYAPLGAIVSMYPTVSGSFRTGMETLAGLATGMLLALGALLIGTPNVWTISVIVGIGVLLGGLRFLGASGREYVPMAALFVLVLGGDDPDGYSFGYGVQMLVGVVVGLAVNALVFPPLHLNGAVNGLVTLRKSLARQLRDMGTAMEETWPPEHEDWAQRESELDALTREVREAVELADNSRHGNIRSRKYRRDFTADYRALRAMERATRHVKDMTEVLTDAIWRNPEHVAVPASLTAPLANAVNACGEAVEIWDPGSEEQSTATEALVELVRLVNTSGSAESPVDAAAALAMDLRRILRIINTEADDDA
ncbi:MULTISPECIES: FUSC family protein [unclassified Arthrobacter]|uniref:FUSC family protein n=1 Tax=unclassified Arthrobacter TaxID=235627 RepID=UPI001E3B507E|nr:MULTISPECIES: FUSC family protein [unclassified Arthrobacter]MCC9145623.1 FUSC family protein [Arthrobacter sp. zg-Y919]MDK1276852.1 FUSC family protein [Arthrobacter sp. zg.Y919]MDM7989490.1 FUSC family protein [Arthrobacter sp. zg-Y877]WIB04212.1 FUSC family protein [Arthrobacter sp. zg-Y919]